MVAGSLAKANGKFRSPADANLQLGMGKSRYDFSNFPLKHLFSAIHRASGARAIDRHTPDCSSYLKYLDPIFTTAVLAAGAT